MPIESLGELLRANGHPEALQGKSLSTLSTADEWYLSNGYYRIAEARGVSRGWGYGGSLSESDALQLSAVFACLKILGEDTASLPLHTYERSRDGKSQDKARDYPLYRLLHDAPNPETTALEFREGMTATAALCGDAFAKIERSSVEKDRVIALWRVLNHQLRLDRDKRGQRVYIYKDGNEPEETLYPEDVLHVRGFSLGSAAGLSFLKIGRRVLGLAKDQEEYASAFFKNDRTPGVVLNYANTPKSPDEIANIRNAWIESIKSHGIAVTHSGAKAEFLGSTNTDAQLVEQRDAQVREVCRYFRMPPHKLADLSRANFTNIENENNGYYTNTMRPWLVRWEQAINLRCIPLVDRSRYFVEHSIEGFLRGDFKTQTEGFARLAEKGVLSVNEIRSFIGLNPIEGGDEHFIQLNMTTLVNAASAVSESEEQTPQQTETPIPAAASGSRLVRVKGIFQ